MHRLLLPLTKPRSWAPQLSPLVVRLCRPLRRLAQRHAEHIHDVEIRGIEHLQAALSAGHGVLITPNHCTFSDPFLLHDAVDRLGTDNRLRTGAYFMTAWQVFGQGSWLKQQMLRMHGAFSVDRDGADLQAFRTAIEILQHRPQPLVLFPEGEMYHLGDRITPFHEGAAAIAIAAARKSDRPVVCLPCALKYYYLHDPTTKLAELLNRLEAALFWRPRPDLSFVDRIYRLAEGVLSLKEIEHLGSTSTGPLPERLTRLSNDILSRLEARHRLPSEGKLPDRVKRVRRHVVARLADQTTDVTVKALLRSDLDDLFLVVQLFCYPGDYVAQQPTLERIAETLDKLEEDIFRVPLATHRAPRAAIVSFGEAIPIEKSGDKKNAATRLTEQLEERVQSLLDSIHAPERSFAVPH